MPDRKAIERFLEKLTALRIAGDAGAVAEHFADDAIFTIHGVGAPAVGKEAVRVALHGVIADYEFLEFSPIEMVIEGDRIAIRHRLKLRYRPTGKVAETETADFIVLREGKVASYVQFVDTVLVGELGRK